MSGDGSEAPSTRDSIECEPHYKSAGSSVGGAKPGRLGTR